MAQPSATVLLNRLLTRARFRHVQVLARLAELGSLRRTAEAIGMTQPGVTQLLADLEALLGTPLFHRHARGVRPTPAGADLLPLARHLLGTMASAADAIAQRQGLGEGVVRVMGATAAINGLLVRALPAFNDRHPNVQVHVRDEVIETMLNAAARGEVDLVLCRARSTLPEGWAFHELQADRFVVACGPDHRLVRKRAVGLSDLAREAWLPAPAGSVAREQFDALALRFAAPPALCNVVTRVPSITWALLRHRPLLTVVPEGVVRHYVEAGDLAILRLKDPLPLPPLGMLLPLQDMRPATAQLAAFLLQYAKGKNHGRR